MATPVNSGPEADITRVLAAWSYSADAVTARKLTAEDGRSLLQIRLDLGLLQMETTGRPDGQRPHGCESLFDYFESELAGFVRERGTNQGFTVAADQSQSLREEAAMYYHRYLASFVLGDFGRVVSDTARNLRLFDFFLKYVSEEQGRQVFEQHRPYVLMMHARAQAAMLSAEGKRAEARSAVDAALSAIRDFFSAHGRAETFETADEVIVLRQLQMDLEERV